MCQCTLVQLFIRVTEEIENQIAPIVHQNGEGKCITIFHALPPKPITGILFVAMMEIHGDFQLMIVIDNKRAY